MTTVTKANMVVKSSGEYFYTYIPTDIAQKLGLKKGQEHLIWNLYGSKAEVTTLPVDIARKIIADYQPKIVPQNATAVKKSPRLFIKNGIDTDDGLI